MTCDNVRSHVRMSISVICPESEERTLRMPSTTADAGRGLLGEARIPVFPSAEENEVVQGTRFELADH